MYGRTRDERMTGRGKYVVGGDHMNGGLVGIKMGGIKMGGRWERGRGSKDSVICTGVFVLDRSSSICRLKQISATHAIS